MASKYSVSLDKLIKEFGFETLYLPEDAHDLSVTSQDVNRPGLILAGRDDYFDPERVQFLGLSEIEFLKTLSDEMRYESLKRLVQTQPPFILITRNLTIGTGANISRDPVASIFTCRRIQGAALTYR